MKGKIMVKSIEPSEAFDEIESFLAEKKEALSCESLLLYQRELAAVQNAFLPKPLSQLCEEEVTAYFLSERKKLARRTIQRRFSVLRSYYEFLFREGKISRNPLFDLRGRDQDGKSPELLTLEEIDRILSVPSEGGARGYRDRALLEFLFATGCRVSEAVAVNLCDVELKWERVRIGKGSKERVIPLYPFIKREIREYLEFSRPSLCKDSRENALFVNSRGARLSRQAIWRIVLENARLCGIDRDITPLSFRNSLAFFLMENGADIDHVAIIFGNCDRAMFKQFENKNTKRKRNLKYSITPEETWKLHPRQRKGKWDFLTDI